MKSQFSILRLISCLLAARNPCVTLRRKNYALAALAILLVVTVLHLNDVGNRGVRGVSPLWPLGDVTSEARRLLELMANIQYRCERIAPAMGNSSMWPLCVDNGAGLLLSGGRVGGGMGAVPPVVYTIGYGCGYSPLSTAFFRHEHRMVEHLRLAGWCGGMPDNCCSPVTRFPHLKNDVGNPLISLLVF